MTHDIVDPQSDLPAGSAFRAGAALETGFPPSPIRRRAPPSRRQPVWDLRPEGVDTGDDRATRRRSGSTISVRATLSSMPSSRRSIRLGSVKDRLALAVIETAERTGDLKRGQTVVEATSGNTGIGLAMVCAQKGYPLVIVMAENFSIERRKLMRFLGAKVVLTPAAERGTGMIAMARTARRDQWLVLLPSVRKRGQCRHPYRDDGAVRSCPISPSVWARLLGHRLRHRRHVEGGCPRA